jgi:hypothetical protein
MRADDVFTTLGTLRTDLEAASADRLADAVALAQEGRNASAIAMSLYAVELCLKARICHRLDLDALPKKFQIHDFDSLLLLAGLKRAMDNLGNHPVKLSWDAITAQNANKYINELRYKPALNWTPAQAAEYLRWVNHPQDGVIPWVQLLNLFT